MLVPATRMSKMKDMLYVIIPKSVAERLKEMGIDYGDLVLWKDVRREGEKVVIILEVVKSRGIRDRRVVEA